MAKEGQVQMESELCCVECFADDWVRKFIASEGEKNQCSFCGKRRVATLPPVALSEMFAEAIRELYEPVSADNTAWDSETGEALFGDEGEFLYDLLQDDWDLFAGENGNRLLEAILEAGWDNDDPDWPLAGMGLWTSRSSPVLDRSDEVASAWRWFCQQADDRESGGSLHQSDGTSMFHLALGQLSSKIGLRRRLFRARINEAEQTAPFEAAGLGAPPAFKVRAGRCNRAGQPVLYTAETRRIAVAEVRPAAGAIVSIGTFAPTRVLRVLDTTDLPLVVSPFMEDVQWLLQLRRLLREFGRTLAMPIEVAQDMTAPYRGSQLLAEMLREHGFDGVRYPSGWGNAHNVVLFELDAVKLVDSGVHTVRRQRKRSVDAVAERLLLR